MAESIVAQKAAENNDPHLKESGSLWDLWWDAFVLLQPAFVQLRSFLWFTVIVAGLTIRTDTLGVTSIIRALKLHSCSYENLIKYFNNNGVKLDTLTRLWATVVVPRLFAQNDGLIRNSSLKTFSLSRNEEKEYFG